MRGLCWQSRRDSGFGDTQWLIYEITSCDVGIGYGPLRVAQCNGTIQADFSRGLFLVLAVPVVLCIIPAVIARLLVSWIVSATMGFAAIVEFVSAFSASMPSLLSMVESHLAAVLALGCSNSSGDRIAQQGDFREFAT
ncbi:hypothetical protein [uncultured Rhodococcus sp.]|uniref:hypothetical protein n=1 Tax=uncultured Rhodococcus sp. TaxID=194249 RepID=UPI0028DC1056|nr:hypothetical protein [uncultured Rhodococcus sp.]